MATERKELTWQNMDVEALPADLQTLYTAYKNQQALASAKRAAFEAAMIEAAKAKTPAGKVLRFGYKFGKLSWAFDDMPLTTPKAKPTSSLFG